MDQTSPAAPHAPRRVVVLVAAGAEWRAVRQRFPAEPAAPTPYGEWFSPAPAAAGPALTFFHTGWGKIAAAGAAQYALDRWRPELLVNLGTCGGFAGAVEVGTILLVEKTVVYDIVDRMVNPAADTAIARYTTTLDLTWLKEPYPVPVRRALMLTADRDLAAEELAALKARYAASAGDWESGALAYVAARNRVPCLILRGVSDLVSAAGGEAYGDYALFTQRAEAIMNTLLEALPAWLQQVALTNPP